MSHDVIIDTFTEIPAPHAQDRLGRTAARKGLRQLEAGRGLAARSWLQLAACSAQAIADDPASSTHQRITWRAVAAHRARVADECREVRR